jgi:hypothetical protein
MVPSKSLENKDGQSVNIKAYSEGEYRWLCSW